MLRSVTRLSHARGNVRLDALPRSEPKAHFETSRPRLAFPPVPCHKVLHQKLDRATAMMESSPYNFYGGPEKPEVLVITSGSGLMYSLETVSALKFQDRVGLLKLSTTWPLPRNLVLKHLKQADAILFVEEVDPFLENNVKELFAQHCMDLGLKRFYGKATGTVSSFGEITPEMVTSALERLLNVSHEPRPAEYAEKAREVVTGLVPARALGFCAGCPHRATYWAIKRALALDGREGLVLGDIGCYGLGMGPSGFFQMKTIHAMERGLLSVRGHPQWKTVQGGSVRYVEALTRPFADRIRLNCPVVSVRRYPDRVAVTWKHGGPEDFDAVVLAAHSDQSLAMLVDARQVEREILGAFAYQRNETVLHVDPTLLPRRHRAWASWNYRMPKEEGQAGVLTYNLNRLQGHVSPNPVCVTLNGTRWIDERKIVRQIEYHHPVYSREALGAHQKADSYRRA